MTPTAFRRSVARQRPPGDLPPALLSLWWAKKGDWAEAHDIVMNADGTDCAWVHAWLHRAEGDVANARYWYCEAGRKPASGPLAEEWKAIVAALLSGTSARPTQSRHKPALPQRRTG